MRNTLAALTLAVATTTGSTAYTCSELQEKVITDLHKLYSSAPLHEKLCKNGVLFYADKITIPHVLTIIPDGRVGVCDQDIQCREEKNYKELYKAGMKRRSI